MSAKVNGIAHLIGMTVAGVSCAYQDGLYTMLPVHIDWLIEQMRRNVKRGQELKRGQES